MVADYDMGDSVASSTKKKNTKSLSMRAQTVEELFGQVSDVVASTIAPPPPRVVLTPRSAEACLKHGVNPEVLRIRDLDSFWEVGIEPEIQRLRQETYSKRRLEMMKIVRKERKKLVNQEQAANDAGGGSSLTPAQILAQQQKQNSTLVEIEERRLAKMRRRQEKELEQMLQFEVKMNDIQEEMKRKTEKEKRAEEKRIRDKEKRLRAMAEERRIRELRRKAAEDAEEEMRREMQEEMFQRDMTTLAEKKRNDRKAKVQGRINDEERARHQEEHRLMTQRLFKEQQDTLMTKAGERARKEKIRMAKVEAKRKIDGQRYKERRQEVEERILTNLDMAKAREEKRKMDYYQKKDYHERLRAQAFAEQEKDREMKNRENFLMEQKRQLALQATKEKEEMDKEMMLQKFDNDAKFVEQLNQVRGKEHALLKEKENLNKQLKQENVERIKRIQEYKRLETLKKISEGDKRTEEMMRRKEEIIQQRRIAGLKTKMQKDEIMSVLESSRANGSRAIKMLTQVLKEEPAGGKKKKKKKKNSTSASDAFEDTGASTLGPPPDAPSLQSRMAATEGAEGTPLPYISPYEGYEGEGQAQHAETVTF
ncbi:hypothetical protein TeGR_g10542 [Tetraparma gracilis]|uniref:Trichohyalin-plectin-homology domain-containing protein n=1 Tax=Tetraparma gracilis TaxID=2962635 RepID=A0ABQ6MY68_9STRA|nr:hypothetical protein TeGR_g10542 [Tetraparma gracilis]